MNIGVLQENKLPTVLTVSEIMRIIRPETNLRHRTLLLLTYLGGLRVDEVVRLRLGDLDVERKAMHIRQGKGRKYRIPLLSDVAYGVSRSERQWALDRTRRTKSI